MMKLAEQLDQPEPKEVVIGFDTTAIELGKDDVDLYVTNLNYYMGSFRYDGTYFHFENRETGKDMFFPFNENKSEISDFRVGKRYQSGTFFKEEAYVLDEHLEIKIFKISGEKLWIGIRKLDTSYVTKLVLKNNEKVKFIRPLPIMAGGKEGRLISANGDSIGITSRGLRNSNEDGIIVTSKFIAVADGMGGRASGEKASEAALKKMYLNRNKTLNRQMFENVCNSIKGSKLHAKSGTTLAFARKTMVEIPGLTEMELAHVGDTKILVISFAERNIVWESKPQSVVQELYDQGLLDKPGMYRHKFSSQITNVIAGYGLNEDPEMVHIEMATSSGIVIIYSDGVLLSPEEILPIALNERQFCGQTIIDRALERQGKSSFEMVFDGKSEKIDKTIMDNVSVVTMLI